MADVTLRLILSANGGSAVAGLNQVGAAGTSAANRIAGAFAGADRQMDRIGISVDGIGRKMLGLGSVLAGGAGVVGLLRGVFDNTVQAEESFRQLEARVRSTGGAAGFTAPQLANMAGELQKLTAFGDEDVQGVQALLLTFTKLTGSEFARAQGVVLDVATALGTDLQSAAIQVGKALNDPIAGLSGLSRAGIQFSADQKIAIKQMVDMGDIARAQGVILDELSAQMGGAAVAARGTLGGAIKSLGNAFGDLLERTADAPRITQSIEGITQALQSPGGAQAVDALVAGIGSIGAAVLLAFGGRSIGSVLEFVGRQRDAVVATIEHAAAQRQSAAAALQSAEARTADAAATLRAIEATRADVLATRQAQLANVAEAEAALAAAEANGQGSFALRVQTEATAQLTAAKARLGAITTELAVLGRQETAVRAETSAAITAQTAAQARLTAATANGTGAIAAARAAGSRLFTLIGGWPTIALGATVGIGALWSKIVEGEQAARKPITALDDLIVRLREQARLKELIDSGRATPENAADVDKLVATEQQAAAADQEVRRLEQAFEELQRAGGQGGFALANNLARAREAAASLRDKLAEVNRLSDGRLQQPTGDVPTPGQPGVSSAELQKSLEARVAALRSERLEIGQGLRARLEFDALNKTGAKSIGELDQKTRDLIDSIVAETAAIGSARAAKRGSAADDRTAATAAKQLLAAQDAFTTSSEDLAAQLDGPAAQANLKYTRGLAEAGKLFAAQTITANQLTTRIDLLSAARTNELGQINGQVPKLAELLGNLQDEAELIGLSADERERAIVLREVEAAAQEKGSKLSEQEIADLKARIAAQLDHNKSLRDGADAAQAEQEARERARDQSAAFGGDLAANVGATFIQAFAGGGNIGQALGNAFTDSLSGVAQSFNRKFSADLGNSVQAGLKSGFASGDARQIVLDLSKVVGSAIGTAVGGGGKGAQIGSSLGTAIGSTFGPIGSVVGGILGGLVGGLFGGKPPTLQVSGQRRSDTELAGSSSLASINIDNDKTGIDTKKVLGAIITFDNSFGALVRQFDTGGQALGRVQSALASFSVDLRKDAATVENVLAARFDAVLGTFDLTIQEFANRGGTLDDRVQRFASILAVQSDLASRHFGTSLAEFVPIIDQFGTAGEAANATAQRIFEATGLLETGLGLSGVALDKTRVEVITFAADIERAAGGIDRAQSLWSTYFETFFSANERAAQTLSTAGTDAAAQLGDIGLTTEQFAGPGGLAAFRQLFSEALPTLGAEATVQWLEAAAALAALNAAQQAANVGGSQTAEQAAQLATMLGETRDALDALDMTPLQIELRDSQRAIQASVEAARLLGATEDELAQVRELGVRQGAIRLRDIFRELADAIGETRASIAADILRIRQSAPGFDAVGAASGNIAALQGQLGVATDPAEQISLIEQLRSAIIARFDAEQQGIEASAQASAQAAQAQQQAIGQQIEALRRLGEFADSLGLQAASPLTARERLAEAQRLFDSALAAARPSDANSIAQLQQAANALLTENRAVFGVSAQAQATFARVQASLRGVAGQGVQAAQFGSPFESASIAGLGNIGALQGDTIAQLQALDDQLRAIQTAQEATLDGSIQTLGDLADQDATNHAEDLAALAPLVTASQLSADASAAHLREAEAQSARLAEMSDRLQRQLDLTGVMIETIAGASGAQGDQVAALIERLGRAIERNGAATVRA